MLFSREVRKVVLVLAPFVLVLIGLIFCLEHKPPPGIFLEAPDGLCSRAMDINDAGQVVGTIGVSQPRVFIWTQEQGMKDIGVDGVAYSINNRGQVLGVFLNKDKFHMFLWSPETGMEDIGPFHFGNQAGYIYWGKDDDVILGRSPIAEFYVWTRETGMRQVEETEFRRHEKPSILNIKQRGQSALFVKGGKNEEILLSKLGGKSCHAYGVSDKRRQAVGIVIFERGWWWRSWDSIGGALNLPQKLRVDSTDKYRYKAALWTIPDEEFSEN